MQDSPRLKASLSTALNKGPLVLVLPRGYRDSFSTLEQHTQATKDLTSLSIIFPHLSFLTGIFWSQNTVPVRKSKSFSPMGLLFPMPHSYGGDCSVPRSSSAAHTVLCSFLSKALAASDLKSCWWGGQPDSEIKVFSELPPASLSPESEESMANHLRNRTSSASTRFVGMSSPGSAAQLSDVGK